MLGLIESLGRGLRRYIGRRTDLQLGAMAVGFALGLLIPVGRGSGR